MCARLMSEPARLVAASATVERLLWVGAALLVAGLVLGRRRATGPTWSRLELGVRGERAAMLVVLTWVLITRLVGLESPQHPRVSFAEASVVFIADTLQGRDLGRHWLSQLRNAQVLAEDESPIQAPVAAVLQRVLGPSIELPSITAVPWVLVAVLLAWRLGRSIETPAFGVLFAAMIAIAPLQVAWAHIGGIHIGAPAAVLLALWIGWLAGSRGSATMALLSGVVAWTSVYYYFAARVGLVLSFVALWAGWHRSGRGPVRLVGLATVAGLGLVACVVLHGSANPGQQLWPSVASYVGSRGEASVADWLASGAAAIREHTPLAIRAYFWSERLGLLAHQLGAPPSRWTGTLLAPGMGNGGLILWPVLVLGLIGMARCLRHPIERALWLLLALAGFLPPIVAPPTARRFLVFDVGWCAFAALGLLWVLESWPFARMPPSGRWRWAGLALAGTGVWSVTAIAVGWAVLPSNQVGIPFAESGFGDECTCLGCVRTGRVWQREIEEGRMVVLLDTDVYRENATCPGALPLYGKIAALAAGHPDRFVDYYTIPSNRDWLPPRPGLVALAPPTDVASALGARIEAAKPGAIVWWFSQPNAWERRLADVLVEAGSTRTSPPPEPMWGADRAEVTADPIRVETPWDRRYEALAALRALVDPDSRQTCIRLERIATRSTVKHVLVLAPIPRGEGQGPPEWAVGSFDGAEIWGVERFAGEPQGLAFFREIDGSRGAALVDFSGNSRTWTSGGTERPGSLVPGPRPPGRDCLALHDGRWWAVDPIAGTVHAPADTPPSPPLPSGVVGITPLGDDRVVLATADQHLHVVDPATRQIERSFPAMVVPSRRFHFGECAVLVSGDGWIASVDQMRGLLFFYDLDGTPLGRVPLAPSIPGGPVVVYTVRGAGDYLGVGYGTTVLTLRVVRNAACSRAAPDASRQSGPSAPSVSRRAEPG